MSLKVEITSAGGSTYYDVSAYLAHQSVTIKLNTFDFTLVDPTDGGANTWFGGLFGLQNALWNAFGQLATINVRCNLGWAGTLVSIRAADIVDISSGHSAWTLAATNSVLANTVHTPGMALSNAPAAVTTDDYLLEDGSGHYTLEDGTFTAAGALQIEGGGYGYSSLSVLNQYTRSGSTTMAGELTTQQPGIWPGDLFYLTSTNLPGLTATGVYCTEVQVTFPANTTSANYRIYFSETFNDVRRSWSAFIAAGGL